MNRLEYQVGYARMSLARSTEALMGKPQYFQGCVNELPIYEAAARETGHNLQVVARYEDPTFSYSRRSGLVGRSHEHRIPLAEDGVVIAMDRKVMDPWNNGFWGKVIEIRAAVEQAASLNAA